MALLYDALQAIKGQTGRIQSRGGKETKKDSKNVNDWLSWLSGGHTCLCMRRYHHY